MKVIRRNEILNLRKIKNVIFERIIYFNVFVRMLLKDSTS